MSLELTKTGKEVDSMIPKLPIKVLRIIFSFAFENNPHKFHEYSLSVRLSCKLFRDLIREIQIRIRGQVRISAFNVDVDTIYDWIKITDPDVEFPGLYGVRSESEAEGADGLSGSDKSNGIAYSNRTRESRDFILVILNREIFSCEFRAYSFQEYMKKQLYEQNRMFRTVRDIHKSSLKRYVYIRHIRKTILSTNIPNISHIANPSGGVQIIYNIYNRMCVRPDLTKKHLLKPDVAYHCPFCGCRVPAGTWLDEFLPDEPVALDKDKVHPCINAQLIYRGDEEIEDVLIYFEAYLATSGRSMISPDLMKHLVRQVYAE